MKIFIIKKEYNLRGAMMAARTVKPDIAIAVDIAGSADTPDLKGFGMVKMGGGPVISLYNFHGRGTLNGTIPHPAMVRLVEEAAKKKGIARNPLWIQIVSDITGLVQIVPELTVGAAYGDALLAGMGIGALTVKDIKDLVKPRYVTEPDRENHHRYEPYKRYYRELYLRNRDIMHQLWQ